MKKMLLALCLSLLASAASYAAQPAPTPVAASPEVVYNLTVTFPSSGVANMSWDPIFGGADPYRVTVTDLDTGQTVASFSTYNLTATVSGLTAGHTGQFKVQKGTNIILIDLVLV